MNDPSMNDTKVENDSPPVEASVQQTFMTLEPEIDHVDIWGSTIGSITLLGANITLLCIYHSIFGFHLMAGESPEHWKWAGGLFGIFAVLIRMAVIGVFACPYTICAFFGIKMSYRVAKQSPNTTGVFNWCLLASHIVVLLPLFWPLFRVMAG